MKTRTITRAWVLVALMLNLGFAGLYAQDAQERSANVRMTFSGTMLGTTINLQPGTVTDDVNLAGDGSLGPFTFRELHADTLTPPKDPPATCAAPLLFLPVVTGSGVLRFQDGSLLVVNLVKLPEGPEAGICIDFAAGVARLTETYEITRGTKRLNRASGTLTLTATVIPVLFNAAGGAQFLTSTGKFEGTISGVGHREEGPGGQ
jgi:hypothetical protein